MSTSVCNTITFDVSNVLGKADQFASIEKVSLNSQFLSFLTVAQFHIPKNNVTSKSQWPIGAICIFINWIQSGFGPHSDPSVIFIFISIFGLFCRVRSPLSNPAWVIVFFLFCIFSIFGLFCRVRLPLSNPAWVFVYGERSLNSLISRF